MTTHESKSRPDPQRSLVGFTVGSACYAVPIANVREIMNPIAIQPLPHSPSVIVGVADHRGQVIPIVDLRVRFGLEPTMDMRRSKWILVSIEDRTIGLVVDKVTEVFGTAGRGLRPVPLLGGGEEARGIVGITTHEEKMVFVLDLGTFANLEASAEVDDAHQLKGRMLE